MCHVCVCASECVTECVHVYVSMNWCRGSLIPRPHTKNPGSTSVLNLSLMYMSSNACSDRTRLISNIRSADNHRHKGNVEPERALFHSISVDRDSS